jgi:hypothetical protein
VLLKIKVEVEVLGANWRNVSSIICGCIVIWILYILIPMWNFYELHFVNTSRKKPHKTKKNYINPFWKIYVRNYRNLSFTIALNICKTRYQKNIMFLQMLGINIALGAQKMFITFLWIWIMLCCELKIGLIL